jgi:hypothetical protein
MLYIDGKMWMVEFPFLYLSDLIGLYEIAVGVVTDFNSIPRILWWLLSPTEYGIAGLVHDDMYRSGVWDRHTCDRVHRELLVLLKAPPWKVKAYYRGLRLGGWVAWRKYRKQEAHA